MVRNVLVPIDGSRDALRALDHAIASTRPDATIHVLNVELLLDEYGMVPAYLSKERHRQLTAERARQVVAPAVARLKRARRKHEAHIVWGDPAEAIVRNARRLKCAGIVMGTRGMGLLGTVVLGSVAFKVVHLAKIPVTLVK